MGATKQAELLPTETASPLAETVNRSLRSMRIAPIGWGFPTPKGGCA